MRPWKSSLSLFLTTLCLCAGCKEGPFAPSVTQQEACLLSALADAGLTPDDVDYIEGHGTGTPLGDPIELQALAHVFRESEAAPPLWVTVLPRISPTVPCAKAMPLPALPLTALFRTERRAPCAMMPSPSGPPKGSVPRTALSTIVPAAALRGS